MDFLGEHPEQITKKWLALKLGYYSKSPGGIIIDYRAMSKYVYTPELVEDILGLTYSEFKCLRKFNTVQTKKIIDHVFS